jgi:hypothetical protein
MLVFQLGLLFLLLAVCSFAPGFYFVGKLPWKPLEKLCGSIGLSLILLYLVSWGIYCLGDRGNAMPVHRAPYVAVSLVCAAMAAACWKDIGRLVRVRSVRRALAGYGFLLVWTGVLAAMIRNFSGAFWFGDWMEHFHRSLFFLQHFPANITIFPSYPLPARPPMMNVLAAFFMAQTGDRFEFFQAAFVFLNLLLFLPCYLIMPALGRRAKRRTCLLVILFAASPVVMQNVTYTWTKSLAAFYIVLAVALYLAGWRKKDTVRTTAAFVALAAGLLVHYSAGPYVVILALHYLLRVFPRRPNKWRELAGIAAACGLLLGTWLLWSLAVFGAEVTFASNTAVTSSQEYRGSNAEKIATNLFYSIVPIVAREPALLRQFDQPNAAGKVRDWAFIFYQVNAIFGMGLVGGPLVLWLVYRALRRKPQPKAAPPPAQPTVRRKRPPGKVRKDDKAPEIAAGAPSLRRFWLVLIVAGVLVGIAVVGESDPLGVAHLTLLALQALGLSMLAAAIPWRRRSLAILLLAGCAVDFSMGVLLQARVESLDNTAHTRVFPELDFAGGAIQNTKPGADTLTYSAWQNWYFKHRLALHERWVAELGKRHGNDGAFQKILPKLTSQIATMEAEDATTWQGWFGRHGGELEFLGDHLASRVGPMTGVGTALLVALFLGLAGGVILRTR